MFINLVGTCNRNCNFHYSFSYYLICVYKLFKNGKIESLDLIINGLETKTKNTVYRMQNL